MTQTQATTLTVRGRLQQHSLFIDAVSQSKLPFRQKLQLRLAYMTPNGRDAIDEYIEDMLDEQGDASAMSNGDIIKYIIEHLPEIAAFIMTLFKLFGGLAALLLPLLQVMACLVVFCLPSIASAQAVYRGRNYSAPVCSSPNCQMCNYIRAQLQSPAVNIEQQSLVSTISPSYVTYEAVQVPYQVKVCNNGVCSYETRLRTERRPVRNAIEAVRNVIDDATPRINMLRITDLAPTPREAVVQLLAVANPQPDEVLYDLGCGDGRVLVAATYGYNCRSVGVELSPTSFKKAADLIDGFGLADRVRIYQGDVLNYTYEQADVVTMYLYPELIAKLLPKLRKGTRVVSYLHPLPGGNRIVSKGHTFYTLTIQ